MYVIWMYYICHVVIVTWPISVSCGASLPFLNPLPLPHGIVKCPLYAQFRITPEVVRQSVYSFMTTVNSDILLLSHTIVISDAALVPLKLCRKELATDLFFHISVKQIIEKEKNNYGGDHLPLVDEMEADFAVKVAEFRWTWIIGEVCRFTGRLSLQFD